MKKITKLLLLLAVFLVGCGKQQNAQDVLLQVKTNINTCSSVDFDMHVVSSISTAYESSKISQKAEYSLNIKESVNTAYITGEILTSIGASNDKYTVEAYQTNLNNNYSLYYKEDGTWYRQDASELKGFGLNVLKMFYNSGMSFTGEPIIFNEKECLQLCANVYGELAADFASMFGVTTSEEDTIGVTLYIYKDSSYPAYFKADLKSVAQQAIKNSEMDVTINEMYIEMTFQAFNETEVSVPEDIKSNAQKKQEGTNTVIQPGESHVTPGTTPQPSSPPETPSVQNPAETMAPEEISNLSNDWTAFQFGYDGKIYRIPMALKTFESSGYAMADSERTMIIESGKEYKTTISNGLNSIELNLENTTSSPKTLYECDIVSIGFDSYLLDQDQLAKFIFNGGLTFASSYENVVSAWGEPSNLHDGAALKIATYQDDNNKIEIYFDPSSNTIIKYKILAH